MAGMVPQNMSILISDFLQHLVTLSHAAQILGVSKMTLRRWEGEGKLTTYRIGREVLLEGEDIERLKAEREQLHGGHHG